LSAVRRRNAYRNASVALGFTSGTLTLIAVPYSYFLFTPWLLLGGVVTMLGSLLMAMRHTTSGASLIIIGAYGGVLGLPSLLWELLWALLRATWVFRLPLLPLGLVLPLASFVLALMSRGPSRGEDRLP
jgi:hypothetical protein